MKKNYGFVFCITLIIISANIRAQIIFSEDFNGAVLPKNLVYENEVDLGHELGVDGSNFFRFHPRNEQASLEFPPIALNGKYELSVSYSKNGFYDEDSIVVHIDKNQDNEWTRIGMMKEDTKREWITKTFDLGEVSADAAKIQIEFLGSGNYPAPYIAIDNIVLNQVGIISGDDNFYLDQVISIVPNPSNGHFRLSINSASKEILDLQLLNLEGKVVHQLNDLVLQGNHPLDLRHLSNGIYSLTLSDGQKQYSQEIIINK